MSRRIEIKPEDMPYTVVAHTALVPRFHIALKGRGLRALVAQMDDEDVLHITVHHDKEDKITISKP